MIMFVRDKSVMIYIEKDNKILMLYRNKEDNDLNHNKYIGVGGHLEEGETPDQTLIREVKEETNLNLLDFKLMGTVDFYDDDVHEFMYVYFSNKFDGELSDCDEGTLYWIDKDKVLDLPLWEGDKYFIEPLLNNEAGFEFIFNYHEGELVSYKRIK